MMTSFKGCEELFPNNLEMSKPLSFVVKNALDGKSTWKRKIHYFKDIPYGKKYLYRSLV